MIVPDDKVTFVSPDRKGNLWLIRNGALVTTMPDYARLQTTDISRQLTPDYNNNELRGICYDSVTKRYYGAVRHSSGYMFLTAVLNCWKLFQHHCIRTGIH